MTEPAQIGRYEIRRELGRGGMATVYLAHDPLIGRDVAVKVLPREFLHEPAFRARFEREVRTVAALEHPAIVPVYDFGEQEGQPYLVMRYLAGGSLKDRLETGPLPFDQACQIAQRVATALDEAHSRDVVHRDLKPANVLFDRTGEAYLSDFGIVKLAQASGSISTGDAVIGTPAYMSPEQVYGDRPVNGRSDLYALGILLYQMLTGQVPFEADTPAQQMMAHVLRPVPDILAVRPDLPPACGRAIGRALAKAPEDRYATAAQMVTALRQGGAATTASDEQATAALQAGGPDGGGPDAGGSDAGGSGGGGGLPLAWLGGVAALVLLLAAVAAWRWAAAPSPRPTPNVTATHIAAQLAIPPTHTRQPPGTATPADAPTATPTTLSAGAMAAGVESATPTVTASATPSATPSPTSTPTATATPGLGPETSQIGVSASGAPLQVVRFGNGPNVILFVGGINAGFAPGSVELATTAVAYFRQNPDAVPARVTLYILPELNPDSPGSPGVLEGRLNGNGVDLNRNWDCRWRPDPEWRGAVVEGLGGPEPFSEPETRALADFILEKQPAAVVFWQARISNGLISPGSCGLRPLVSEPLARTYGLASGYGVADYEALVAQEVNGDSVNWVDWQGIPAIAVLLPDYDAIDWDRNLEGMLAVLRTSTR